MFVYVCVDWHERERVYIYVFKYVYTYYLHVAHMYENMHVYTEVYACMDIHIRYNLK